MFRRIKADVIKTTVHKKLYGPDSQGNDLTKFLIVQCNNAKKGAIDGFIFDTKETI